MEVCNHARVCVCVCVSDREIEMVLVLVWVVSGKDIGEVSVQNLEYNFLQLSLLRYYLCFLSSDFESVLAILGS